MKDWVQTLATVAPTIATALGGPVAGMAVQIATSALGIDNNQQALEDAVISGNPEVLLKLRTAEANLKIELKRLDIELEKIHGGDRDSARDMAKVNMLPQIILSAIYTIGYCVILWQFVTGEVKISEETSDTFTLVLGVLTAAQTQIMNFWFGSSSGSKHKDGGMK